MLSKLKLNQLYFKDTQFANLMTRRVGLIGVQCRDEI